MRRFLGVIFTLAIVLTQSAPASALSITIMELGALQYRTIIDDIEDVEGGVFSLDPVTGEVTFNDGIAGERPPAGQPGIGSYDYGAGSGGNILEYYPITADCRELVIPSKDVLNNMYNFVLSGIRFLEFDISPEGIRIASADIIPVPEPTTILLLCTGIAGLGVFRKKFKKS